MDQLVVLKKRNRETEVKQKQNTKKARSETDKLQGKHFNLKSVSESFRCVLVFTVK